MKIKFLGPLDIVTGSSYWLKDEVLGVEFLVDCGIRQGEVDNDSWNGGKFPFKPRNLNFVVLTHAHLDHCGLLPRLYREGFQGVVYCTRETADLARLNLEDASQQEGATFRKKEVARIKWHEHQGRRLFSEPHPVGKDLFLLYFRSAHLPGAVSVQVVWGAPPPNAQQPKKEGQRSIIFSGDLGVNEEGAEYQSLLRHRMRPYQANYAVIESTYGTLTRTQEQKSFEHRITALQQHMDETLLQKGGVLLMPCFALGRTQEVLFDLHYLFARFPERYREIPVYLHAKLARRVNQVYAAALQRTEYRGAEEGVHQAAWAKAAACALARTFSKDLGVQRKRLAWRL